MDIASVVIGVAQIGIMYWGIRLTQAAAQPATERRRTSPYVPLALMGLLAATTWIPYFLKLREPERVLAIAAWGSQPDGCYTVVDDSGLKSFSGKYVLAMACGISSPMIDHMEDTNIAVSNAFTIAGGQTPMEAKYPQKLLDTFKGMAEMKPPQPASIWREVFLVPKNFDLTRIRRMSDVRQIGGKLVRNCEPIE
jgi:hypothetical protein